MEIVKLHAEPIPIILYDKFNKRLNQHHVFDTKNVFIKSICNFGIEIIEGDATIISAKIDIGNINQSLPPNQLNNETIFQTILPDNVKIEQQKSFPIEHNYCYNIVSNSDYIIIRCYDISGNHYDYELVTEEYIQPEHYSDLLTNYNLPTYEELKDCILFSTEEISKANLIARLLLEYEQILKHRGKITGIEKFLNFIGLQPNQIKIFAEYKTPEGIKTLNPNKHKDVRTGWYHIIYDNFIIDEDDKYTIKNLPKFQMQFEDMEFFFETLFKALALANVYFTLPEQDISFIGINNISNSEQFYSIAGNTYLTEEINPQVFEKNININMKTHYTSVFKADLILCNMRTPVEKVFKSEVKYRPNSNPLMPVGNKELFVIDKEIYDDEVEEFLLTDKAIFGNIIELSIDSDNTYVEVSIVNRSNIFSKLFFEKQWIGEQPLVIKYISTIAGIFDVTVKVWDMHNNYEVYFYEYSIDKNIGNIDLNVYISNQLMIDRLNQITSEISSPSVTLTETESIVLRQQYVPQDLQDYFNNVSPERIIKYLTENQHYQLPELNQNFIVDDVTELPCDYIDNWLHIIGIPFTDNDSIPNVFIKIHSISENLQSADEYFNINDVINNPDNFEPNLLFVTIMDIQNPDESITKYLFISTIEAGIDIIPETFDIILSDSETEVLNPRNLFDLLSIEDNNVNETRIPVNIDFTLFHRDITNNDEFYHVQRPVYKLDTDEIAEPMETVSLVKSIFPRLVKSENLDKLNIGNVLKLGDVMLITTNPKTIINSTDLLWTLKDAFTGEILHQTNDFSLKYRINENTIYDVTLDMSIHNMIENETYSVTEKSIVSSIKL